MADSASINDLRELESQSSLTLSQCDDGDSSSTTTSSSSVSCQGAFGVFMRRRRRPRSRRETPIASPRAGADHSVICGSPATRKAAQVAPAPELPRLLHHEMRCDIRRSDGEESDDDGDGGGGGSRSSRGSVAVTIVKDASQTVARKVRGADAAAWGQLGALQGGTVPRPIAGAARRQKPPLALKPRRFNECDGCPSPASSGEMALMRPPKSPASSGEIALLEAEEMLFGTNQWSPANSGEMPLVGSREFAPLPATPERCWGDEEVSEGGSEGVVVEVAPGGGSMHRSTSPSLWNQLGSVSENLLLAARQKKGVASLPAVDASSPPLHPSSAPKAAHTRYARKAQHCHGLFLGDAPFADAPVGMDAPLPPSALPPVAPEWPQTAAADVFVPEDVGAAFASAKRRSSKGKGGRGGGGRSGGGGGGSGSGGGGSSGGGGGGGTVGGSGGSDGSGGGSGGSGGSGGGGTDGGGTDGGGTGARRVGSGGGQCQQQQHRSETPSPQQLREWFLRGASGGSCPYVIRMGDCAGQTCGRLHTRHRCFSRLSDAWRAKFGDDVELPRWADLLKSRIAIFDLDFDAILSAMYALSTSVEGDCYRCVPPDPGIAAAALGARESGTLLGTAPAEALHTFTLDSGASRCFFHDSTTLTPLPAPLPVRLADPSEGMVVAHSSTVLLCPAVTSGSHSGLHLPSFSTNLVSTAALQDAMVTTTTPGGQRVLICTCTWTGRHLATFTRRPKSSLYTLSTEPPLIAASSQVSASGQVAASCSCRLLWHHRLGHPSLPRLHGMHSHLLVSGLPRSLPPLPPSPAPPCLPCIEGRHRATPHSSSFPPTTAPLQTLHMDVWGPARVSGQSHERYFLLVVDDYTRYTTVFPLRSKSHVVDVLIPWIRTVHLQLRERFGQDLPVLRLHSDRGGEFSSTLLWDFCHGEGILQSFTLSDSPQKNGIAERRIGLVMEVARTSMIHAAAPHFMWPFAVWYAVHQLNLWPRVSLPETSPTLRWTGKVVDASVFRVLGSRAFVRDTSADKLSARAIPCDVTFDESVPFYRLFPYRSAPPPPPPLFLAPDPPPVAVDSGAARGAASAGAEPGGAGSQDAETGGAEPGGVETGGAVPWGATTGSGELGGTEPEGVEPGAAASEGAESGGAEPQGATLPRGSVGALPRLSPQQLREWFVRRAGEGNLASMQASATSRRRQRERAGVTAQVTARQRAGVGLGIGMHG
ncbi:unnamed protein product [Closterium sp. NIES-54]